MADALTPMMQQYQRLRASVPTDTLLLFRLGDFYELFFEDAKEASGLLNLALTHRNSVPMCGMPYHAAQGYIAKLIQAGRRVAICDQTSEPQPGKIVTREITQIITAGTVSELDLLKANRPNYLGAIYFHEGRFGFAYAELSTGEFRLTAAKGGSPGVIAVRGARRLRDARRRDPDQSRVGGIPRATQHEPPGGARSHSHADGRPEIAELDFAAVARSCGIGMPPAIDRRF